jgi:hypothetical protein
LIELFSNFPSNHLKHLKKNLKVVHASFTPKAKKKRENVHAVLLSIFAGSK